MPSSSTVEQAIRDARISQVDLRVPVKVSANDSLSSVLEKMRTKRTGCVVVTDSEKLVGIVTERDVLKKVLGQQADLSAPIRNFMTTDPASISFDQSLGAVIDLMAEKGFRHLPCINREDAVEAIISIRQVVNYIVEHFPNEVANLPPHLDQTSVAPEGG